MYMSVYQLTCFYWEDLQEQPRNAMIKSAAGADGWTMGVHLLQQMPADQLQPNIMTSG